MSSRILRNPPAGSLRPFAWPAAGAPAHGAAPDMHPPEGDSAGRQLQSPSLEEALARNEQRWREEVESARSEAWRQGLEEGKRQAAAQMEAALARLARSIEEIAGYKPRLRQEAERDVVDLAIAIARRILRREIQIDAEALLGLVKAAFEKAGQREITRVRVHPAHGAAVRACLGRIGAPEAIEVVEDPSLEAGAVVVETARGLIDASVETQLEEIGRGLADALQRRPSK
jgi:flagellar assembly protein FliH